MRHEQICQSDVFFLLSGAKQSPASPLPHRLDESATGYSSVGCSPALPASASPAGFHVVPNSRNSQALLNLLNCTTEQVCGIFNPRDNFPGLATQNVFAGTPAE